MKTILDFEQWPLDLLIDYALKIHHRSIREDGPEILDLLQRVAQVHKDDVPDLQKVADHFRNSLADLDMHLQKEENILFPFCLEMYEAYREGEQAPSFHCGSVQGPISVMMAEHADETERHQRIAQLTNDYTTPEDADEDYREAMRLLKDFRLRLEEHTRVENEVIFPMAMQVEMACR
uniref:Hemerythrin-like domain-containing protein n=2 Tax=unclassified Prevotella TaxID=2638335 RepID=A0AB33JH41_9BACT